MTHHPLNGLKVVDLTRFLAGPYCTMLLGDHGAEVLKVEPPGSGDPTRVQGPPFPDGDGLTYHATNRNKASLVLDLKDEKDLTLLKQLIAAADVLVENYRPGVLSRFGLGYEQLRKDNPGLVYGTISGFGTDGPMAEHGAFDLTIQAMGGYMSITGERDARPVKLGTSGVDMLAGMNLFSGLLIALLEKQRTGLGQHVETSLLESQVAFLANSAYEYLMGYGTPGKWGSEHAQLVPYKAFLSSDGWVVIGAGVQNLFIKLVNALGRPDLLSDPRFRDLPARLAHRDVVNDTIESVTKTMTTDALVSILSASGVPCAPVAGIDDVFKNPQVLHRQMLVHLEGTQAERSISLGSAIKYSSFEITHGWTPPPKLDKGGRLLASSWLGRDITRSRHE